jgi:hypothetical protein
MMLEAFNMSFLEYCSQRLRDVLYTYRLIDQETAGSVCHSSTSSPDTNSSSETEYSVEGDEVKPPVVELKALTKESNSTVEERRRPQMSRRNG